MTPPLLTQPSPPNSLQIGSQEFPTSPLPHTHADASAATRLASESDLEGFFLAIVNDALFGVYQGFIHQNSSSHMDRVIDKDNKWQVSWVKLVCFPTQFYAVPSVRFRKRFL